MCQNIKWRWGPLSADNFPWAKPIERYSSVSNLSGKVLERYSRMPDADVWWRVNSLCGSRSAAAFLHTSSGGFACKWRNGPRLPLLSKFQRYANGGDYAPGWWIHAFVRVWEENKDRIDAVLVCLLEKLCEKQFQPHWICWINMQL